MLYEFETHMGKLETFEGEIVVDTISSAYEYWDLEFQASFQLVGIPDLLRQSVLNCKV